MYKEKADKIANYKTYSKKQKIDALLELNASIYTNIGTDSTKQEKSNAEISSRHIYRHIQKLDEPFGRLLLRDSKT